MLLSVGFCNRNMDDLDSEAGAGGAEGGASIEGVGGAASRAATPPLLQQAQLQRGNTGVGGAPYERGGVSSGRVVRSVLEGQAEEEEMDTYVAPVPRGRPQGGRAGLFKRGNLGPQALDRGGAVLRAAAASAEADLLIAEKGKGIVHTWDSASSSNSEDEEGGGDEAAAGRLRERARVEALVGESGVRGHNLLLSLLEEFYHIVLVSGVYVAVPVSDERAVELGFSGRTGWERARLGGALFLPTVESTLVSLEVLEQGNFSHFFDAQQSVVVKWSISPIERGGRTRTWLRTSGFQALLIGMSSAGYTPGSVREWRAHASRVESCVCVLERLEGLRVSSVEALGKAIRVAASARAGKTLRIPPAPLVVGEPGQSSLQVLKANEGVLRTLRHKPLSALA